jgi:hypothetical protein
MDLSCGKSPPQAPLQIRSQVTIGGIYFLGTRHSQAYLGL